MTGPRTEDEAPVPAGANQRRHVRRTSSLPAVLSCPWGDLHGKIENIGAGGAFFVTGVLEGPVEEGDTCTLRYCAAAAGERSLPATVLRVERYFHEGDLYRALALRFHDVLPDAPGPA